MSHLAVVAFGGNALLRDNQKGTIEEQEANAYRTCFVISELLKKKYKIVITHGNGPQVGNILLRNEAGFNQYGIVPMPLDVCVADSQGGIGYMIERQLQNLLEKEKRYHKTLTIITQVIVSPKDPAFKNPTKPIGPYFTKEKSEQIQKEKGGVFKEDAAGRGWRKVVASPKPKTILNSEAVSTLVHKGVVVVAVGGGGIPIIKMKGGGYIGTDAVIDKDVASAKLGAEIGADEFYILTDVPRVYVNFRKPNQQALDTVSLKDIKKYLKKGEFGAGSMAPKIQAAINFLEGGGKRVIITEAEAFIRGEGGTTIINDKG